MPVGNASLARLADATWLDFLLHAAPYLGRVEHHFHLVTHTGSHFWLDLPYRGEHFEYMLSGHLFGA